MFTVRQFSNGYKLTRSKMSRNPLTLTKRNYNVPSLSSIQNRIKILDRYMILGGTVVVVGLVCYVFYEHNQYKKLKRELKEEKENNEMLIKNNETLNEMLSQFMHREKLEQQLQETKEKLSELSQTHTTQHLERKNLLESMHTNISSINTDLSSIKQTLSNSSQQSQE